MERLKRREREYLIHKKQILSAAERVFGSKGFFESTMSEIAHEAEFGMGTLYKFFDSKEDLYFSVIEEKLEEINRLIKTELYRKASAIEKIRKTLELQFRFTEEDRHFFRIYISERSYLGSFKEDLRKSIHDKMMAHIKFLASVMRRGIKEGEFKPLDPMDLAHGFIGIVNSFIFEWLVSPKPYPLISKINSVLEIFLKGAQKEKGEGNRCG